MYFAAVDAFGRQRPSQISGVLVLGSKGARHWAKYRAWITAPLQVTRREKATTPLTYVRNDRLEPRTDVNFSEKQDRSFVKRCRKRQDSWRCSRVNDDALATRLAIYIHCVAFFTRNFFLPNAIFFSVSNRILRRIETNGTDCLNPTKQRQWSFWNLLHFFTENKKDDICKKNDISNNSRVALSWL